MVLEQKVKLLQMIYAGALADSVFRMGNEGILEKVTSEKREEQIKTGKYRAAQFGIEKPKEVFLKLSELFGCADWAVESENEDFKAEATKCMLCAMAKKMGAQSPCNIFCLDPMEGMIRGIDPNYSFNTAETLWTGHKCEVNLIKEAGDI